MVPQREKQKRDRTSLKNWTEQTKMDVSSSLSDSLCCGSFSVCFLMLEEVATEVMCAVDEDATGSMH